MGTQADIQDQDAPRGALLRMGPGPIAAWLMLAAGLALIVSAVLIPAADDLAQARWQRDAVLNMEAHTLERIDRHERYLDALERGDPHLARSLAAQQLNLVPVGRNALIAPGTPPDTDLYGSIEPAPPAPAPRPRVGSVLEALTTGERTRLWVIAAGAVMILAGLLPAVRAPYRPA